MNAKTYTDDGHRSFEIAQEVVNEMSIMPMVDRDQFIGRLINLLCEQRVITVEQAGHLFHEYWEEV